MWRPGSTTGATTEGLMDAVVIGGGHAGLAASHRLAVRGIEHVVLEAGRVGEMWRSQRWESFALNTPNWMNLLPGDTEAIEPRDGLLGRADQVGRLEQYVELLGRPVAKDLEIGRSYWGPECG